MLKNVLLVFRFVIAAIFVVSGFEKAVSPSENFLYLLQSYQVFPDFLARVAAVVFPWFELGVGVFLALGFWLRPVVMGLLAMSGALILVVGQAIVRGLPIESCGCFGELVHLPLRGVIVLDSAIFMLALLFLRHIDAIRAFSLDRLYDRNPS